MNSYRKKHGEKDRHEHSRVHFAPSVCRCPSGMPQHILRFLSLGQIESFLFQTWTTPLLQSVQFSRSVVSNPLRPNGMHSSRLPCPSFSAISKAMLVYIQRQFVGKWKTVNSLSRVQLVASPWTVAHQVPLSVEFFRQGYCSGLPFPSPGPICRTVKLCSHLRIGSWGVLETIPLYRIRLRLRSSPSYLAGLEYAPQVAETETSTT